MGTKIEKGHKGRRPAHMEPLWRATHHPDIYLRTALPSVSRIHYWKQGWKQGDQEKFFITVQEGDDVHWAIETE